MNALQEVLTGIGWFAFAILFFGTLLLILLLISSIFWICMIIDCAKRNMPAGKKITWILAILLLHILGALSYYYLIKRKKTPSSAILSS